MKHMNADSQFERVKRLTLTLDADDVASVRRGMEQMEAGMGRPFHEVAADIRKTLGFPLSVRSTSQQDVTPGTM